jgi:hypothetical protein
VSTSVVGAGIMHVDPRGHAGAGRGADRVRGRPGQRGRQLHAARYTRSAPSYAGIMGVAFGNRCEPPLFPPVRVIGGCHVQGM